MVQLGFVIDHSRCIGCHACTVACKSENEVPVGSFRTWVKYTEEGAFPEVKRSFAVLRCNQCTDAPCMEICPTSALFKRDSGIVDLDRDVCIGCKSCMQGCPYDALYINPQSGTAEKCHFCAHRTERGLAPACAVVCPTEAIIPGDFDDPTSRVSQMVAGGDLAVRKPEAETGPNVWYRDVADAGVKPAETNGAGGYLWADQRPGAQLDAERFHAEAQKEQARTTYDVSHPSMWGGRVTAYLFTKSISAGTLLTGALLAFFGGGLHGSLAVALPLLALAFLGLTTVLLVTDLKRPERFLLILTRPNWSSWLVKGSIALMAYGLFATIHLLWRPEEPGALNLILWSLTTVAAGMTAAYTAFLFGQAKGRVLWMKRGYAPQLIGQALLAGAGLTLVIAPLFDIDSSTLSFIRWCAVAGLVLHGSLTLCESMLAPPGREAEFHRVSALITHGPFARKHWTFGVALGLAVPLLLFLFAGQPAVWSLAALLALIGLVVEEDVFVRAGQALPIS